MRAKCTILSDKMIMKSRNTFLQEKENGKSEEACLEAAILTALKTQYSEKISEAKLKSNKKRRNEISEKNRQASLNNLAKARKTRWTKNTTKATVNEISSITKNNNILSTNLIREFLNQRLLSKFLSFRV